MTTGTEFSVISLISNASFGVQFVIFILFISSLYSWAIIFKKLKLIQKLTSTLKNFENDFWQGKSIADIYTKLTKKKQPTTGIEVVFINGFKRFIKIKSKLNSTNDSNKNKRMIYIIKSTFDGEISMQEQVISKDLAILATISSTAPYVGLFGTVWGILIAFWGFASEANVTIAVIAPHISEALIATAMGLLVAIPAQIAYNKFNIVSSEISDRYKNITHETITLLSQEILVTEINQEQDDDGDE